MNSLEDAFAQISEHVCFFTEPKPRKKFDLDKVKEEIYAPDSSRNEDIYTREQPAIRQIHPFEKLKQATSRHSLLNSDDSQHERVNEGYFNCIFKPT
jgi:hypothetical protein